MPTTDQATQVSFPVLLRSQQKALKRYATLADIKPPIRPPMSQWQPLSRPKSLNLPMETTSRSRLSTMTSCNTLSPPRQYSTDSPGSYSGSYDSFNYDRSHIKWGISPQQNQDTFSSATTKTMCSCQHKHLINRNPKESPHSNTPQGLSWRRLHMSRAKLKATATTSELLSGFAMVAMVELQINEDTQVPEWLFVLFAVCTTILVAVHIFALMISTYILPNIDAISKLDVCELVTESPHERMRGFIELAWAFSTVLGLFLFLVEIAILCWVKFWDYSVPAAIAATVIVIPVLILFVAFAIHFYHSLVVYKCDSSVNDIEKLEDMKKQLDLATSPV